MNTIKRLNLYEIFPKDVISLEYFSKERNFVIEHIIKKIYKKNKMLIVIFFLY